MTERTQHGGKREGAGAPAKLKDPVRRVIIFEAKQLSKLARYAKKHKGNYSSVIRDLLDEHL